MDMQQAFKIAEKYAEVVAKEFNPKQILLFGSYLNGNPHEYSDIDIAVIFDSFSGDWWDGEARLQAIRREIDDYDIEPHLMELEHDPSGFVHHVQKIGKVLYQKA